MKKIDPRVQKILDEMSFEDKMSRMFSKINDFSAPYFDDIGFNFFEKRELYYIFLAIRWNWCRNLPFFAWKCKNGSDDGVVFCEEDYLKNYIANGFVIESFSEAHYPPETIFYFEGEGFLAEPVLNENNFPVTIAPTEKLLDLVIGCDAIIKEDLGSQGMAFL